MWISLKLFTKIITKVCATSSIDFHSYMKEMYQQLSVVPLVKNILLQTTTWNNLEAHYVKAIIRNFYANDVINGLFHLNVAAGGVHKESAYLYGVLLLCARIDGRWRVNTPLISIGSNTQPWLTADVTT